MRAAIVGNVIGRMAQPGSELATWNWLQTQSALGELLDVDFDSFSHMRLYRASDRLLRHRAALEEHLFSAVHTLFALATTVTLYDLTNTFFEGDAAGNPKAQRGRSKEKRSDCPLVTLGLVLDGSGFVRRSRTFAGNVSEGSTLAEMLAGLAAPAGALVIMDAGIATAANLAWLVAQRYRYLVVRRGGQRQFDASQASASRRQTGRRCSCSGAQCRRQRGPPLLPFATAGGEGSRHHGTLRAAVRGWLGQDRCRLAATAW